MTQRVVDQLESFGGKTVVITGGTSGIGLASARMVIDRRGSVILVGRIRERLNAAREELGAAASTIQLDVTDEDAVKAALPSPPSIASIISLPRQPEHFAVVLSISIPGMRTNFLRSSSGGSTIASNTRRRAWPRTGPSSGL